MHLGASALTFLCVWNSISRNWSLQQPSIVLRGEQGRQFNACERERQNLGLWTSGVAVDDHSQPGLLGLGWSCGWHLDFTHTHTISEEGEIRRSFRGEEIRRKKKWEEIWRKSKFGEKRRIKSEKKKKKKKKEKKKFGKEEKKIGEEEEEEEIWRRRRRRRKGKKYGGRRNSEKREEENQRRRRKSEKKFGEEEEIWRRRRRRKGKKKKGEGEFQRRRIKSEKKEEEKREEEEEEEERKEKKRKKEKRNEKRLKCPFHAHENHVILIPSKINVIVLRLLVIGLFVLCLGEQKARKVRPDGEWHVLGQGENREAPEGQPDSDATKDQAWSDVSTFQGALVQKHKEKEQVEAGAEAARVQVGPWPYLDF
ncbi:hypothetical protein LguiB_026957 [Lonicera macranthoides]